MSPESDHHSDWAGMRPGEPVEVSPGLRRILAPNPSAMTGPGTNTYLVGDSVVAVVDPGPDDPAHLAAILAAIGSATISHILITHAHRDHSALAPALAVQTGAPICAFGPPEAGRSATMQRLADDGLSGGGEGVHVGFQPDKTLRDGQLITGTGWQLRALHTPGHFAGHLSFALGAGPGGPILTGDLVLGWSSTLISPPDGDVAAFMGSCERLQTRDADVYFPGHGAPVPEPQTRLRWLIEHRRQRESQILGAVAEGPATLPSLVADVYADIPRHLHPMAMRNILAHLIDLADRNLIAVTPTLSPTAYFTRR